MKIAVASEGAEVSQHFGHCANFNLFTIEDSKIVEHVNAESPGHLCGSMAPILKNEGVEVLITGGIGAGAMNGFNANGIKVINGASGDARAVTEVYLAGQLQSTGALCAGHEGGCDHEHEGGDCHHN